MLATTQTQLSTVGELRHCLENLASAGVPDEATIIIRKAGSEGIAALTYRVEEDFQPAEHRDAGMTEPAGYWTVAIILDVAPPAPLIESPHQEPSSF